MDTVGTFETAIELAKNNLFTTVHKHYSMDQWKVFFESNSSNEQVNILI